MPVVRAVVFDFNGTLSQDEPILCSIYQELFAEQGRPLAAADYYATLAGYAEETIISGWLGVEGEQLSALVADRIERYRRRVADGSTVSEDTRAAVRYAAERVPVAVVSGAFRVEIEPVLEVVGLIPLVSTLVAAEDVANGKPDPEAYERAVAELGVQAADVVAFEDTEAGVASAVAAGLRCVALRGTVAPERLTCADEQVDRIDVALMRRLLG
jgi:beta-phosphoglucomutase